MGLELVLVSALPLRLSDVRPGVASVSVAFPLASVLPSGLASAMWGRDSVLHGYRTDCNCRPQSPSGHPCSWLEVAL